MSSLSTSADGPGGQPASQVTSGAAGISLTPAALEHVRRYLAQADSAALRLELTRTGCSGWAHEVVLADDLGSDSDARFTQDDVTIVVAHDLLPKLDGTRIDFVTQGLNRVFVFDNPQAGEACGCGESFTLVDSEAESAA